MRSPGSGIGSTGLDGSPPQDESRGPSERGAPTRHPGGDQVHNLSARYGIFTRDRRKDSAVGRFYPGDGVGESGHRAEGIPMSGFLFSSEKVWEVIAGRFMPPVICEKSNPIPSDGCHAGPLEGQLDLAGLVGANRFDAQAIVIGAGLERSDASVHRPVMPARMAIPARFLVSNEMRPPLRVASASTPTVSSRDGRYMATPWQHTRS